MNGHLGGGSVGHVPPLFPTVERSFLGGLDAARASVLPTDIEADDPGFVPAVTISRGRGSRRIRTQELPPSYYFIKPAIYVTVNLGLGTDRR